MLLAIDLILKPTMRLWYIELVHCGIHELGLFHAPYPADRPSEGLAWQSRTTSNTPGVHRKFVVWNFHENDLRVNIFCYHKGHIVSYFVSRKTIANMVAITGTTKCVSYLCVKYCKSFEERVTAFVFLCVVFKWVAVARMVGYHGNNLGNDHRSLCPHGPLTRYAKSRVAHNRECRGRFPLHHGLAIPTCITARAWCTCRDTPATLISGFLWSRWRGKRSRHSRRMRNPQFCVSGKSPIVDCCCRCCTDKINVSWRLHARLDKRDVKNSILFYGSGFINITYQSHGDADPLLSAKPPGFSSPQRHSGIFMIPTTVESILRLLMVWRPYVAPDHLQLGCWRMAVGFASYAPIGLCHHDSCRYQAISNHHVESTIRVTVTGIILHIA